MKYTPITIILICLIFLSGCTSTPFNETQQTTETAQTAESAQATEILTMQNTNEPAMESEQLSQTDIDSVCGGLYNYLYHCDDGSDVLVFSISHAPYENAYIRYIPKRLPNGDYEFFRKLTPSPDIRYDNGRAEIPLCVNDTKDYRFILTIDFSIVDGDANITGKTFTFLNDEDREFNDMFAALEYDAIKTYCESFVPDESLSDEETTEFLKACVYNGNMKVLDELYKLTSDEDIDSRHRIELAASVVYDSGVDMSPDNPYMSEIFYGESCKDFPQSETLDIVAKSLQVHESLQELGAELIESNYDWASVYKIPNLKDYLGYIYEDERTLGVYNLDMDKDGLQEILIFTPGGSMGNVFWAILHLDKSGLVTDLNTGEGMNDLSLYRYNGDYFFMSYIIDFNDKEFEGWQVYALNKNSKIYRANIFYDKIGATVVFNKKADNTNDYYYFGDWSLYGYISAYKHYEYEVVGRELVPDEEVKNRFNGLEYPGGKYGTLDFNNDNTDDLTNVYMFFPSNTLRYSCDYKFVESTTGRLLDFSQYFRTQADLRLIVPYHYGDKNYFVCVLGGDGNYFIKLIEIRGIEPIELHSWMVSVKNRILVEVSESTGSYWGI